MSQAVEYDYVVVGAGAAGRVPAARLSEDSNTHMHRLEAGGAEAPPPLSAPPAWPRRLGASRNWGERTAVELRVRDIDGLQITDASVMPSIVSGNTNAAVHGTAKRAADVFTQPGRW
ncbi:GMC oxidoreductase [Streptomyces sp. NPDC004044]